MPVPHACTRVAIATMQDEGDVAVAQVAAKPFRVTVAQAEIHHSRRHVLTLDQLPGVA